MLTIFVIFLIIKMSIADDYGLVVYVPGSVTVTDLVEMNL